MKTKTILFLIIHFALTNLVYSQQKLMLSGKVTDAGTGKPLAGASIYITDMKIGTVADAEGKYILRNVPPGHHVIEVSFTGYGSLAEHFDMTGDTEKNFSLSVSIIENQGVIITGVTSATSIRKAPTPVNAMRKSELMRAPSTNIIDALTNKPGIAQVSSGPAISKPVIRGLGYNRVVVVNDGIRQEGQQWGDEHGIEIDEQSVNKAEILKGPASLIYGSDALAGVIHLISNVPVAEGTLKGNLFSNYQTNNKLTSWHGNLAGNQNGFNWNLYGSWKSAGDYKNKFDGRVLNSRFNENSAGGYLGINRSWGYSHLLFSYYNQNPGLVEGDRDDATGKFVLYSGTPMEHIATDEELHSRKPFIPKQNIRHYRVASDNSIGIGRSRLKFLLGFQNNLRTEFGEADEPDEKSLLFDLKTVNYNVQWRFPEKNDLHFSIGVNGMAQNNKNKGEEVLIPEYNLFDIGLFVFAQKFLDKTTLSGGLRYDNRTLHSDLFMEGSEVKFPAFNRTFSNVSGSFGVSYEPLEKFSLKANLARGFRAPNIAELGSNGAHEGTNRYEYGEKDLKSETSWQADLGLAVDNEHFSFSISTFYNRINHFIFYRKLLSVFGGDSLVNVGGEDITAFRFSQQDARLAGFEASLDFHPHPLHWLHFENTLSYVRGKFSNPVDGSKNLPLIPALRFTSELRADINQAGKHLRNLYVKLDMRHTAKQKNPFTGYDTETETSGYTLFDAGFGSDFSHKGKTLFSIHLAALNIGDVAYQDHLSRLKYTDENMLTGRTGVFNMGRNFSFKLNVPLDFSKK
jgi:iron complex outermembrane receptor protein